jgi:DNA gyrase subunit B
VEKARFDKMLSNDEITTMISALGTSIGPDDFDPARLRYHRIIIMTDADVDGSHIRTLLLTFFYRQMTELLRSGNIYIAQPPLYRVQVGKRETYLHREKELTDFLMSRATEDVVVTVGPDGKRYEGTDLIEKMHDLMEYRKLRERLGRKTGSNGLLDQTLAQLAKDPQIAALAQDGDALLRDRERLVIVQEGLRREGLTAEVRFDPEYSLHELIVSQESGPAVVINHGLLSGAEWHQLVRMYLKVLEFESGRLVVHHKDGENEVDGVDQLVDQLLGAGKRNVSIQRYKGLGEMNPIQLWETTMNPETRTLLRVKIEDAIETDEIFTILMGDQVEPRRRFIEENALNVKNLDI